MLKPFVTTSSSCNYQLFVPVTSNRSSSRSSDGRGEQIMMAVSVFRHRRCCKALVMIVLLICLLVVPLICLSKSLQNDINRYKVELEQLKLSVEYAKVAQREAIQRNSPEVALPQQLHPNALPSEMPAIVSQERAQLCQMHNCFDHSRCSLTSGLPIYFYDPDEYNILSEGHDIEEFLKASIKEAFKNNPHTVSEPKEACLYLVLVNEAVDLPKLYGLPSWGGNGRNHVLLNLEPSNLKFNATSGLHQKNTMSAIVVQSSFERSQFRLNYDLVVPPILGPPNGDVWQECTPMSPARRKYLLSYQGELRPNVEPFESSLLDDFILDHLMNLSSGHTKDHFLLQFECDGSAETQEVEDNSITNFDVALCGSSTARKTILENSTFVLILTPGDQRISSARMLTRLYEALRSGAIPVILGADQVHLPFEETIDWRRVALLLPQARITELHFLLRSVQDSDLLLMRRQGRLIWERYLSSVHATVDTIIASLRDRLGIPPRPVPQIKALSVFNSTFVQLKSSPEVLIDTRRPELLGPIREHPFPSPIYQRNYTILRTQSHGAWNDWMNPFYLYPQLPFDPVLPTEAKFLGSETGFRPVGYSASDYGNEFRKALGGNYPYEQFTIVILTYEREETLIRTVNKLHRLPYLHKVIVIWNSPKPPSLSWPEIDVPIEVVHGRPNSLNNRFLPLDIIETEAVLSLDDDIQLGHDDIIFAFRVWREHRDRLVGFPARVHAWNQTTKWLYNAEYSCELSMVLTGAAFVHKYYLFAYTYDLPQAIRDKVNEYMNCEDIALNFLISHITRQPPIKVTSLRNFECKGCPVSLSTDSAHYEERNECVNFFTQVFGYNPLLNSQYRADSILYNLKTPNNAENCFRYV